MFDRVALHRAPTTEADADELGSWLDDRVDANVEVCDRFLDGRSDMAEEFAAARVLSPYERETGNTMTGVVRYEERVLAEPERGGGVIYDGLAVQDAVRRRVDDDAFHVVLMDRVLGTWGDHDGRWHKRVNVLGRPALVSVPGLYEAPAKPESYYEAKQKHALVSGDAPPREVLEEAVDGDFLVADDPRTTEALNGYVLQAVDYLRTGDPFCEVETCRLANPHRQPGVIEAQLRDPEFCERHEEVYG